MAYMHTTATTTSPNKYPNPFTLTTSDTPPLLATCTPEACSTGTTTTTSLDTTIMGIQIMI